MPEKSGKDDMRPYFKEVMLVLVVCALTACSSASKKTPFQNTAVNDTSDVRLTSSQDQATDPPAGSMDTETTSESASLPGSAAAGTAADPMEMNPQTSSTAGLSAKTDEPKDAQPILDEALEFCQASQDFWGKGDFDNAVDSLDQAYNLILQADTNKKSKLIQQKEDIRFMICKRMLEIYASQRTVVNGNHNAIPMVMNRHVQKEIKLFQGPERKFFLSSYERSGRYRLEILKALEEAGLPKELSWLPLIESGFKVKALSRARALGLWQFIPSTGYKFGLSRDQWIDERMDVGKSTKAAISYLQELHNIFGDWSTVLAAYNCGEFRVLRVIRNQNIKYLDNFWDLFERLPWETARYVPRFLAVLYILNDPQKYGFDLQPPDPPLCYELVTVPKQVHLKDIAKALDVQSKNIEMLNPELRYKATPPSSYELKVPVEKGSILSAKLDDIPVYTPPRRLYEYHRVRRGETLSHLARRYRTSVRAIMQANNLRSQNYLRVGQKLKIPTRSKGRTYAIASQAARADTTKPLRHRVKRGDSLWLLARAYRTNIQEIIRLNNLKSTRLHIGQTLIIRKGTNVGKTQEDTNSYLVKRGDSPYQIAMLHNMKLERFLRINDLTPRSKIYPGQSLLVDEKG
ncbi:MAG: LysM peptidoglycan-binding domain-containing protein [Proteobacteria bacterium]|nr:LysM peptidoglycan-binding domain-containing protein [Pseudomonadota bacterium]